LPNNLIKKVGRRQDLPLDVWIPFRHHPSNEKPSEKISMRIIKGIGTISVLLSLGAADLPLAAGEPDWPGLERQFCELPAEARRLTGPLFWLHGDESRERLEMYVGKVAEGGNGCFTAESRPHRDWLREELAPEAGARITVNGQYAGGLIGKPLQLEVTPHLKAGLNTFRIEPFAPKAARLVIYE
jgi:hypothetical protein